MQKPNGGGFRRLWARLRRNVLKRRAARARGPQTQAIELTTEEIDDFIEPRGTSTRPASTVESNTSRIVEQVSEGLSQVPPLPHVVRELLVELQDPASTAQSVARIAATDPAVAACLIRTVNSVAFGLRRKITSVTEAVSYLGYSIVRSLVVRMRLEQILPRGAGQAGYDAEDLWIHSLAVSYAADCLADRVTGVDRGLVATLGLLHDIGKLVINSQFPESAARLRKREGFVYGQSFLECERQVLGADHAEIGAFLAKHWRLPEDLVESIGWHHSPQSAPASVSEEVRRAMYVVHLANQLTKYCYVYSEDVEIDIIRDELLRDLGFATPLTRLLSDRVRSAISRAIFFADESTSRPLTAVRRFIRLHEPDECAEVLRWARTSSIRRIKWIDDRVLGAFDEDCRRIDLGSRSGMRIGPAVGSKVRHACLTSVTTIDGVKRLIDATVEHQDDLDLEDCSLMPARFIVRWLLPNLIKLADGSEPIEIAQWRKSGRLLLAVRSPVLEFGRRFGDDAERSACRCVLERELGNVLNLRWFSEIRVTTNGAALLFAGHAARS